MDVKECDMDGIYEYVVCWLWQTQTTFAWLHDKVCDFIHAMYFWSCNIVDHRRYIIISKLCILKWWQISFLDAILNLTSLSMDAFCHLTRVHNNTYWVKSTLGLLDLWPNIQDVMNLKVKFDLVNRKWRFGK